MVWNTAVPLGTESKSLGDDRIRELKTDIQTALRGNAVTGTEAIFPGADTSNPVYRYRGLKGTTGARPTAGDYGFYFDETRNVMQRDNGSSWVDVATLIPAGTVMVFYQAAAPVGFTKLVTQDDKALRVVSGTGGGSGGTQALSTSWSHSHTVNSHNHTGPSHTHSIPALLLDQAGASQSTDPSGSTDTPVGFVTSSGQNTVMKQYAVGAPPLTGSAFTPLMGITEANTTGSEGTGNTGSAAPGTDSQLSVVLAYIDVIICSKD